MKQTKGKRSGWVKNENEFLILSFLSKGELTFKELHEKTGLSLGAWNSHRQRLLKEGKIKKQISKETNKVVYVIANYKTIINELIIPELIKYTGTDLTACILYALTKGEKELTLISGFQPGRKEGEGRPLYSTYNLDIIFKTLVEDKYFVKGEDKKITPQEILDEIHSNPELMEYVHSITSKEDEVF